MRTAAKFRTRLGNGSIYMLGTCLRCCEQSTFEILPTCSNTAATWHVLYFKLATYFEKAALRVTTAMGAAPPACAVGVAALNFTSPVDLLRLVIATYLPSDHP